ncbi:MAG: aldo/keto reductase [Clostridia bacterium]|nr:aldo/keto reductase [Clostridia bacterium]
MKYSFLEGIPSPLSALTYGTPWTATRESTRAEAFKSYDRAWDAGFRTFDTAHSYGFGEDTLGVWLASRKHRQEAVILDKGCNPGQKGSNDIFCGKTVREQAEESLRRLRTDHLDLYILHRDDPSIPVDGIVDELNRLKEEGKILRFGGSNWTLDRVCQANDYAEKHGMDGFTAVSPAYSLAEYIRDPWGGSVSLSGEQREAYRKWLQAKQIPVFCYSSLGRGYLSGKFHTDSGRPIEECIGKGSIMEYDAPQNRERLRRAEILAAEKNATVSQVCLAWLLRQPMSLFPIVAPSSREHILDNVGALDLELTEEEALWLCGCDKKDGKNTDPTA